MHRLKETVSVGSTQACVIHGHPKKAGSKTDKPAGTPIKCFPFSGEGGRKGAIQKAFNMHHAISKNDSSFLFQAEGMERLKNILDEVIL